MPDMELTLPDDLYVQIERLAEQEFLNEDKAVEELLASGIEVYQTDHAEEETGRDLSEEFAEDMWDTAEDPGAREDPGGPDEDEYTF